MRKITLCVCYILLFFSISNAQLKQIAAGPQFDEPVDGFAKIIQLKNGNTVYIQISVLNGIHIQVYNPKHEKISWSTASPSYGTLKWRGFMQGAMRTESVYGIMEINNDVVIFLSADVTPRERTIRRLIIDGMTGKLKTDELFAELLKRERFDVVKDQLSESYAISISRGKDVNIKAAQSKVVVYDSNHSEIRNVLFDEDQLFPEGYKTAQLKQMMLINGKLYAFFFAYTNSKSRNIEPDSPGNSFILLSENGSSFSANKIQLKLPSDMPVWGNGIKYNPITKKIYAFTMKNNHEEMYKKNYRYYMYVNVFDPESKNVQGFEDVAINEQINSAYKERFSKKDDYLGMAQNIYVNDDGSFSLICEERMMGGVGADNTWIGKVLQANYDREGKFRSAYIVPKTHYIVDVEQKPFSRFEWENTSQLLYFGSQYKFFLYLDGPANKYILYNDVEKNNNVKGDKYAAVSSIKDCNVYIYKLAGNELVPEKINAFGNQGQDQKVAMLTVADYNKKTNMLAMLMLNNIHEKERTVNLVWLEPQ